MGQASCPWAFTSWCWNTVPLCQRGTDRREDEPVESVVPGVPPGEDQEDLDHQEHEVHARDAGQAEGDVEHRAFLARDRARTERQAAGERPGPEGSFGPERSWRHVPPAPDHRPVASAVGQRNWVGRPRPSDQPAAELLANGVAGRDGWMRIRVSTTRTPSASTITGLQSISAISG